MGKASSFSLIGKRNLQIFFSAPGVPWTKGAPCPEAVGPHAAGRAAALGLQQRRFTPVPRARPSSQCWMPARAWVGKWPPVRAGLDPRLGQVLTRLAPCPGVREAGPGSSAALCTAPGSQGWELWLVVLSHLKNTGPSDRPTEGSSPASLLEKRDKGTCVSKPFI